MAREANELSAIQLDDEAFTGIKSQIRRYKPDTLAKLGNISRTTIFKYYKRTPINPRSEEELKKAIAKAAEMKEQRDKQSLSEARQLITA